MQGIDKINLTKLRKCDQAWENMIPNEEGRLCQKCARTIIDFRQLSDREIAHKHIFTEGPVCGIYHKKQLEFKRPIPKKTWGQYVKSLSIGFAGLFTSVSLAGQTQKSSATVQVEPDYHQTPKSSSNSHPISNHIHQQDSLLVHGVVKDDTGTPLPGVAILIVNTSNGTTSNVDGQYLIDLTKELDSKGEITLLYTCVGYENQTIVIKKDDLLHSTNKVLNVQLKPESVLDFIVIAKEKWPKRTWKKIKGIFRKKDKAKM